MPSRCSVNFSIELATGLPRLSSIVDVARSVPHEPEHHEEPVAAPHRGLHLRASVDDPRERRRQRVELVILELPLARHVFVADRHARRRAEPVEQVAHLGLGDRPRRRRRAVARSRCRHVTAGNGRLVFVDLDADHAGRLDLELPLVSHRGAPCRSTSDPDASRSADVDASRRARPPGPARRRDLRSTGGAVAPGSRSTRRSSTTATRRPGPRPTPPASPRSTSWPSPPTPPTARSMRRPRRRGRRVPAPLRPAPARGTGDRTSDTPAGCPGQPWSPDRSRTAGSSRSDVQARGNTLGVRRPGPQGDTSRVHPRDLRLCDHHRDAHPRVAAMANTVCNTVTRGRRAGARAGCGTRCTGRVGAGTSARRRALAPPPRGRAPTR